MAKARKFGLEYPAPILDKEEETLAAIDECLREAEAQPGNQPDIKEFLLGQGPRFEDIVPKRGGWKQRPPIDFSGPDFK